MLPDLIFWENTARQRESGSSKVNLKIDINENIDHTWLCAPPSNFTSLSGDTVHCWPNNTFYPCCDKNFVPEFCSDFMPHLLPSHISDDKLNKFINGNALVKNFKTPVDSRVFGISEAKVSGKTCNQIDSVSRKGLCENLINDSIIESNVNFLSCILADWDELSKEDLKEKISVVHKSLKLSSTSNLRQRNFLCSIFTLNKLALRQEILDKFNGDANTKDMLKGSCLGVPSVFGPLPESFFQRINSNPSNAKNIVLCSKTKNLSPKTNNSGFNPNSSYKRQSPVYNSYANKRGRYIISTHTNTPRPSPSSSGSHFSTASSRGKPPYRKNWVPRGKGFQGRK